MANDRGGSENDDPATTSGALIALHLRPTREVLARAIDLCRTAPVDDPLCHRRRLGVTILAELSELPDRAHPTGRPAFVNESMQVLLELAGTEEDVDVLEEVARAFGYRRDPRGVPALLGWRDHPDQPMRFSAAASIPACTTRDDASAINALVELTDDENGAVRDYALLGLRELEADTQEIRDAMLRHTQDPDTSAAGEALLGLAALGDDRGIAPLRHYLQDPAVPASHVSSYGLEAATAYADPRLLAEAVRACRLRTT